MSDLRELYHEVILDHSKRPRNFHKLANANRMARGHNPLCGDELTVYLLLEGDVIKDISFEGSGCAISKASASMMTAQLKGLRKSEAETIFQRFHEMVTSIRADSAAIDLEALGKLAVFSGVSEFPVRVKCASLAWHTMHAALEGDEEEVTTE